MRTPHLRLLLGGWVVMLVAALAVAVAGCGSSTPASTPSIASTCQALSAVLSDGPDPSADPVGYAEAQVLPLRQILTPDRDVQRAMRALASAYEQYYTTGGNSVARQAVSQAGTEVDALCPGATS
ncbi:MAG: hypothetical protein ABSB36_06225 [Candidatus Dormibacteria bacterium]